MTVAVREVVGSRSPKTLPMQYVNSPFLQLLRVAMPCTERANVPNSQAIWGKARQYQFFAHYTSDIQESEQRNMWVARVRDASPKEKSPKQGVGGGQDLTQRVPNFFSMLILHI